MKEDEIKKHWNNLENETMYDKNLREIETYSILEQLDKNDIVIDIGSGDGESTVEYYKKVKEIIVLEYSRPRLEKLLSQNNKISIVQMDMRNISIGRLGRRFNKAITQRSLINLQDFEEQKRVIRLIHSILKDDGKYIMLEGFKEGTDNINKIRMDFNLPPIEIRWHNCFFKKSELLNYMKPYFKLEYSRDFSSYFFMTRVFNAILRYPDIPLWNDAFNNLAKRMEIRYRNLFLKDLSRLELLVFKKINNKDQI